jgi:hypothetical protein
VADVASLPSRLGIGGWAASFVLTQLALRRRSAYLRRGKRFFFINARMEKRCAIPGKQQRAFVRMHSMSCT